MTQLAESQPHVEPTATAATTSQRPWLPAALAGTSGAVVLGLLMLLWFGIQQREKGTVGEVSIPLRTAPDFQLGLFDGRTF